MTWFFKYCVPTSAVSFLPTGASGFSQVSGFIPLSPFPLAELLLGHLATDEDLPGRHTGREALLAPVGRGQERCQGSTTAVTVPGQAATGRGGETLVYNFASSII